MREMEMSFTLLSYLAPVVAVIVGCLITLALDWWWQDRQPKGDDDGG
jgi:hypothetical protein